MHYWNYEISKCFFSEESSLLGPASVLGLYLVDFMTQEQSESFFIRKRRLIYVDMTVTVGPFYVVFYNVLPCRYSRHRSDKSSDCSGPILTTGVTFNFPLFCFNVCFSEECIRYSGTDVGSIFRYIWSELWPRSDIPAGSWPGIRSSPTWNLSSLASNVKTYESIIFMPHPSFSLQLL